MPEELKARVQGAADKSGRSLHAELLYRVEQSFRADRLTFLHELALEAEKARARADALSLRLDLTRARIDTLGMKVMVIGLEAEKMAKAAMTDADFAAAEAKIGELRTTELEVEGHRGDLKQLVAEREAMLSHNARLSAILGATRAQIEEGMRQYLAEQETK